MIHSASRNVDQLFSPRAVRTVAGVALFATLTALGAHVRVPLPHTPVPMTLQTLPVLAAGLALGARLGCVSQLLYVLVGLLGLPVFAGGAAGAEYVSGPAAGYTAGYLLGFVVAPWLVGRMAGPGASVGRSALATALGTVVIFALGCTWLAVLEGSWASALARGLVPFIAGAGIKWGLVILAGVGIGKVVTRRPN